jgi:hypothetical protein
LSSYITKVRVVFSIDGSARRKGSFVRRLRVARERRRRCPYLARHKTLGISSWVIMSRPTIDQQSMSQQCQGSLPYLQTRSARSACSISRVLYYILCFFSFTHDSFSVAPRFIYTFSLVIQAQLEYDTSYNLTLLSAAALLNYK